MIGSCERKLGRGFLWWREILRARCLTMRNMAKALRQRMIERMRSESKMNFWVR